MCFKMRVVTYHLILQVPQLIQVCTYIDWLGAGPVERIIARVRNGVKTTFEGRLPKIEQKEATVLSRSNFVDRMLKFVGISWKRL